MRRRFVWLLLALVAAGLVVPVALGTGEAGAHAILERSLPVQNQKLAEPPELIETWYSETLERSLTSLAVLDTQGNAVQQGETLFSDDPFYAAIAVPPDLAAGIYTVTYQNVSSVDGHTWSGFFTFILLNPDGSVPAGEALIPGGLAGQVGFLPEHLDSTLRWLGLLAASVLTGALFFALVVAAPAAGFLNESSRTRTRDAALYAAAGVAVPAAAILLFSNLGQVLLLADRLSGLGAVDDILLNTRSGNYWLARMGLSVGLFLLVGPLLRSEGYRRSRQAFSLVALAALGGLASLITYSLASHSAAGGGEFWAVGSDFIHFAATTAWVGALLQLPLLLWWTRRRLEEPDRSLYLANVLDRFSWLAVVSVAVLIGSGVFNAFVQLPTASSIFDTTYGRVLIAKLALIVPLLGIAAVNALYVKPELVDAVDALNAEEAARRPEGEDRAWLEGRLQRLQRLLPRTAVAELLIGVAVLAAASVLAQTATAGGELRQQATKATDDFVAATEADDLDIGLTISPLTLGVSTFTVTLDPEPPISDEPGGVLGVTLIAIFDDPNASPSAGTTGTRLALEPTVLLSTWEGESALLTQPGDWRLQVRVSRRALDDARSNFFSVSDVGGFLARTREQPALFELPFTVADWNIVAGAALMAMGLGTLLVWRNRPPTWQRETGASVAVSGVFALAAAVVLFIVVDAGAAGTIPRESPVEATQESLATGQLLFTNNCMVCHGETGLGDGPGADLEFPPPELDVHVPAHNDGTIFLWISEGIPVDSTPKNMPAWKDRLTETERWHLVNFLRDRFTGTAPVLPDD